MYHGLHDFTRRMRALITFPTTTEAFIAYQEGMEGRTHTVSLKDVERFYQERDKKKELLKTVRIWESICWWCDRAYQAGKETAQHEVD